ncbi:MAG TPA: dihydrolipoyl dehydrogenase [Thermodesulfobacteriota bacterium]|nr:dihydrolipoyl dehydrogenase [Thermodesulfobacteriota bacterium]
MPETAYDLVVIGSGPGGYVAAIRAAQLGLSVACVERDKLGGVCLNIGCIPTKALLRNAEVVRLFGRAKEWGVSFENFRADFGEAVRRSRAVAERMHKGVEFLFRKNKVVHVQGTGRLLGDGRVAVTGADGKPGPTLVARKGIVLATGSRPRELPAVPMDGRTVISSTEAMLREEAPRSLAIVGAGAVGVEFADIYGAYGTQVTLIEMLPQILPLEDEEISALLARAFRKRGMTLLTSARVERLERRDGLCRLHVSVDGKAQAVDAEVVLVAVGRQANVEGIGLEEAGVAVERGFVKVDGQLRTTAPGVYAIGDCIGGQLWAHKAMAEGIAAVEAIAGVGEARVDYSSMAGCTYCHPQVASVGLTEARARQQGFDVAVGKFPFSASGKAAALGETEGLVKVVADAKTGELLGVHIIGAEATEMIAEASLARSHEAIVESVHRTVHAHPTLSEALAEAAAAACGRAIHV